MMATPQSLPRIEIPVSLSVSAPIPLLNAHALPYALNAVSVSLPILSPGDVEHQTPIDNTAIHIGTNEPFLTSAISPTYVDSHIPPAIHTHLASPPLHSRSTSTSSPELLVPGPATSPLLGQEFDRARSELYSRTGYSPYGGTFSPRSFRSVTSRSSTQSPRISSPPSAAALSAAQLHPPLQIQALRPKPLSPSGSTTAVPTSPALRPHHALYYMADEMVIFEVEGCLYRVNRWHLEKDSEFFRRLLVRHAQNGVMGATDTMPIPLIGVTRNAFDSLLHFLHFSVYEPDTICLNEWITLLAVSTRLQFPKVRRWAIREITAHFSSLDAVAIIVLAIRHDVPQWLAPAYAELCRRRQPLDDGEAEDLGPKITARVGRAREVVREELFNSFLCKQYGMRWVLDDHGPDEDVVARVVQRVFWPESL